MFCIDKTLFSINLFHFKIDIANFNASFYILDITVPYRCPGRSHFLCSEVPKSQS